MASGLTVLRTATDFSYPVLADITAVQTRSTRYCQAVSGQKRAPGAPSEWREADIQSRILRMHRVQLDQHGPQSKMALLGLWQEHVRRKRELLFPAGSSVAQIGS